LAAQICLPCLAPCYTCISSTSCISCISDYIINGTICQQNCAPGYYKYVITVSYDNEAEGQNFQNFIQCRSCNLACQLCTDSSSNCQICNEGYVLYGNQCVINCPIGTYNSTTDYTCHPCSAFCLVCNNSNSCLACTNNTVLHQGTCLPLCPQGFYAAITSNSTSNSYSCQNCSIGCSSCNGSSQYQCSGCSPGYYLLSNNLCVSQCPVGTYPNNLTMTCSLCPYLCVTCTSFSICTSCINNYTLSSTNQCNSNSSNCSISNCLSCANSSICLQCLNNYYQINLGNTSYCAPYCPSGMFGQGWQCINCTSYCLNCSAYGCLICQTGYYLYQMICYPRCPSGTVAFQGGCQPNPCIYYNSTNSNICLQCVAPYLLVAVSVLNSTNTSGVVCILNCPTSTILVSGTCLPCSSNCQTCVSSTICTQCQSGYYLYQGSCQLLCPLGFYSYNSQCNACTLPFCISCIYTSGQYCTSCDPSKQVYLYNGSCLINCPSGTFKDSSGFCLNCNTNCSQCYNTTYCILCQSGYNFHGLCVTTCPTGTYALNVSGQTICQSCSTGCYICNSGTNCITCSSNYNLILTNGQGACVLTCPLGTYSQLIPSTQFSNSNQLQCLYCSLPCITCTSLVNCSLCSTGSLYKSLCVTVCPTGYYSSAYQTITIGNTSYATLICSPCSANCLSCVNNSNDCTSCYPGYNLDTSGNCNSNCSSPSTYYSNSSKLCFNCSPLCYSCYGPLSSNCLSCSPPQQLYAGTCFPNCPFGYFATSTYICQPCSLPCASCQGTNTNCTSCSYPNIYQSSNGLGSCISNCLSSYYLNSSSSVCTPCNNTCLSCTGPASNQCTSCSTGLYLVNGVCLSTCPNGTIPVTINLQPTCQSCPQGCLTCIYFSSNQTYQCTSCVTNLYLYNSICNPNCPPATYASPTSYTCLNCNIAGCQTCYLNNSLQVQCITCQASYYLLNSGICVTNCPQGYSVSGASCIPNPICSYFYWNGYCLNNCPSGTYPLVTTQLVNGTNSTVMSCANCSVNCLSCTSSAACSLCSNNTFTYTQIVTTSINGINVTSTQIICVNYCPQGYYPQNNICVQCPSICLTCQLISGSTVGCISCPSGYVLLASNCFTSCPSGYFQVSLASGIKSCQQCSAQCSTCQGTASNCTQCQNNHMLPPTCTSSNCSTTSGNSSYVSTNGTCVNCNSACLTCFGGNSYECLSCANTSILQNGMCLPSCPSGFIQNGSTCAICPTNCQNCTFVSNNTVCSICTSPYILSPSTDQCVLTCSQLSTSNLTYYLTLTGQCQPCVLTNCLSCIVISQTTQCQTCQTGAFYYNGQCYTTCPNGTASSYNPNSCIPCQLNCTICSLSSCAQCNAGYMLLNGGCVTACPVGYYLLQTSNSSVCSPCTSANCFNCSSATCYSCKQPYTVDSNGQCTNCIDGYYYSTSASACLICSTLCQTCSSSSNQCTSCPLGTFMLNLTCVNVCPTGYYANSLNNCVACSTINCKLCPNNICQSCSSGVLVVTSQISCQPSCPSGMYADSSTGKCFNCSQNCNSCTSTTSCNNCTSPSILYLSYCITSCPSGYTNVNQSCIACITGCKVCTSLSNCTTCQSGLVLNANGSCTYPPNNCSSGYYLNSLGNCSQCFPTCNTCNGGTSSNCLTCFSGYTLYNGVCIQNCNSTSYYSINLSSCLPCNSAFSNCTTCSSIGCTVCNVGFNVSAGACQQVCPNGTYLQNQQCISCSSYCISCSNSSSCNQCTNSSLILMDGQCYTSCPTQTYLSNGICLPCTQTCSICSTSSNCSSCITPYYLSNNSCIAGCPNGTYGSNYICLNCSLNCLLCTDANSCTSCATDYYLLNGTCRSSCPSGYYLDTSSNRCIQCSLPCLICSTRTSCSSCQSPYQLSGTTCISNCSIGYYYNTSLSACMNCTLPHCSYCIASGCLNCQNNYYSIYTNNVLTSCVIICPTGFYGDPISMNCTNCFTNCLSCSNGSWCNNCATGTYLLLVSGSTVNQCVPNCPLTYY